MGAVAQTSRKGQALQQQAPDNGQSRGRRHLPQTDMENTPTGNPDKEIQIASPHREMSTSTAIRKMQLKPLGKPSLHPAGQKRFSCGKTHIV
jgi:hypothetical protein